MHWEHYLRQFHLPHVKVSSAYTIVKRCLDILGACVGIVLFSPLILLIAILIKLTSPGPIFFWQHRIGFGGKKFWFCKFRSMVVDAEARQAKLEHLNESPGGMLFKLKDDPRITALGRFLRRTSLDELPQLWNVLNGSMSMVGPRPLPLRDCRKLCDLDVHQFAIRQCAVPGITGPWQVYSRSSSIPFEEQLRLDLEYVQQRNIILDLKLLALTIRAVSARDGAY